MHEETAPELEEEKVPAGHDAHDDVDVEKYEPAAQGA